MDGSATIRGRLLALWCAVALLVGALGARADARWECLDGRPCGASCTMLHGGSACPMGGRRSSGAHTCAFCPRGERQLVADTGGERCTSNVCVLRIRSRPNASLASPRITTPELAVALPCLFADTPLPVISSRFILLPARAPPRAVALETSSPRAPPVIL